MIKDGSLLSRRFAKSFLAIIEVGYDTCPPPIHRKKNDEMQTECI
jgi:hypothetical protein